MIFIGLLFFVMLRSAVKHNSNQNTYSSLRQVQTSPVYPPTAVVSLYSSANTPQYISPSVQPYPPTSVSQYPTSSALPYPPVNTPSYAPAYPPPVAGDPPPYDVAVNASSPPVQPTPPSGEPSGELKSDFTY